MGKSRKDAESKSKLTALEKELDRRTMAFAKFLVAVLTRELEEPRAKNKRRKAKRRTT